MSSSMTKRLALLIAVFLGACSDTITNPPGPEEYADCPGIDLTQFWPPGQPLFVTPEERASAQVEIDRLRPIKDRHVAEILAHQEVFGMGISYDVRTSEFVFVVYYDHSGPCPTTVPATIEGVPVFLRGDSPAVIHADPI